MKRLILMRHAKSSWDSGAPTDHARPLNGRGRRDAPRMGKALRERDWIPDVVISSDSQRTRETWAYTAPELGPDIDITFTRDLYHAGVDEIIAACEDLDDSISCAMVIGHNPGWEDAVDALTGEYATMTTANCALLQGNGTWSELMARGGWELVEVLRPKELLSTD